MRDITLWRVDAWFDEELVMCELVISAMHAIEDAALLAEMHAPEAGMG